MSNWSAVGWDGRPVFVEQPVYSDYYDWDCPYGFARDDWGQCAPQVTDVFVIEREILYLYPELIATYPDLQLHPEWIYRYRPELRTRYAGVRSVGELRNRYTQVHHSAPPQRPASAPPAQQAHAPQPPSHGAARRDQPSQQQAHAPQPVAHAPSPVAQQPSHAQPSAQHSPTPTTPLPTSHEPPPPPPSQQTQQTAMTQSPKAATATSGLFGSSTSPYLLAVVYGGGVGALISLFGGSKKYFEYAAYGALVGIGVAFVQRDQHA